MTNFHLSRRHLLAGAAGAAAAAVPAAAAEKKPPAEPFRYMFNTSTVRGQKLTLPQQVDVAARAGYQAIEPWVGDIDQFVKSGGNLKDLGKRVRDAGLTVESAIGFAEWIVDDDTRRKNGLETARRDMDHLQQLGGVRLAAPPAGATNQAGVDLLKAAERYPGAGRSGARFGIVPMVEVWGFSRTLSRLGEAMLVAMESGYPRACVLADVYHLYKGGSGFTGLNLASPQALQPFTSTTIPPAPTGPILPTPTVSTPVTAWRR